METHVKGLNRTNREVYIDCLKGFAILCVMWGHTQKSSPLMNWIASFHVAIFLVISGFLYCKFNKQFTSIWNISKKVIKPYVIFSFLAIVVNAAFAYIFGELLIKSVAMDLFKTISLYGIHALWYLPSYAIGSCIVLKAGSRRNRIIVAFSGIVLSILFHYTSIHLIHMSGIYYPLSSIIRGIACSAIMVVGYELNILIKNIRRIYLITAAIILIGISAVFSLVVNDANFSTIRYGDNPFIFYCTIFSGSIGFFILFYVFQNRDFKMITKGLQWCGENSLILLITHSTLKLHIISLKIVEHIFNNQNNSNYMCYIQGGICLIIIVVIEIPIVWLLTHTKLKNLI